MPLHQDQLLEKLRDNEIQPQEIEEMKLEEMKLEEISVKVDLVSLVYISDSESQHGKIVMCQMKHNISSHNMKQDKVSVLNTLPILSKTSTNTENI
jgi:hypothetical protein